MICSFRDTHQAMQLMKYVETNEVMTFIAWNGHGFVG